MQRTLEVIQRWLTLSLKALTALSTPVVAIATVYLALYAQRSADLATESVQIIRTQVEVSQRPFVTLGGRWTILQVGPNMMSLRGELHDAARVPTSIDRVCVWASGTQTIDSQRAYISPNLRDDAIVFQDAHHQWFNYPAIPRTASAGRFGYLSTIYTISREGADDSTEETWRVESEVVAGDESTVLVRTIDMHRTEDVPC